MPRLELHTWFERDRQHVELRDADPEPEPAPRRPAQRPPSRRETYRH
jgi:hypothetical protein